MPNNIVISSCGKSADFSSNIRTNQSKRWSTEYWLRNLVVQKDFQFKYFITFSFYKAQAHIINQYLENRFIKKVILDFFYPNGRKPKDRMRIWFFNEKEGMFKNVDDFEKEKLNDGKLHLHILMECVDGLSWLMKNNRKITIRKSTIFDMIAGDYVMDDVIIEALTNHLQAHIRRLGKSKQSMVSELIKNIDKRVHYCNKSLDSLNFNKWEHIDLENSDLE